SASKFRQAAKNVGRRRPRRRNYRTPKNYADERSECAQSGVRRRIDRSQTRRSACRERAETHRKIAENLYETGAETDGAPIGSAKLSVQRRDPHDAGAGTIGRTETGGGTESGSGPGHKTEARFVAADRKERLRYEQASETSSERTGSQSRSRTAEARRRTQAYRKRQHCRSAFSHRFGTAA